MKRLAIAFAFLVAFFAGSAVLTAPAHAQNTDETFTFPVAPALSDPEAVEALQGMRFYFAGQNHARASTIAADLSAWGRARRGRLSDEEVCNRALLNALIRYRDSRSRGEGNATINIRSTSMGQLYSSATQYKCLASRNGATVRLRGDIAIIR